MPKSVHFLVDDIKSQIGATPLARAVESADIFSPALRQSVASEARRLIAVSSP
jgi:hypothetical protein